MKNLDHAFPRKRNRPTHKQPPLTDEEKSSWKPAGDRAFQGRTVRSSYHVVVTVIVRNVARIRIVPSSFRRLIRISLNDFGAALLAGLIAITISYTLIRFSDASITGRRVSRVFHRGTEFVVDGTHNSESQRRKRWQDRDKTFDR